MEYTKEELEKIVKDTADEMTPIGLNEHILQHIKLELCLKGIPHLVVETDCMEILMSIFEESLGIKKPLTDL